MAGPLISIAFF